MAYDKPRILRPQCRRHRSRVRPVWLRLVHCGGGEGPRVTLIEKGRMGGDCLNTGCVPSKALIRSAKYVEPASDAPAEYGMKSAERRFRVLPT